MDAYGHDASLTCWVDRARWRAFFDEFSRQYEGSLVTLQSLDAEMGAQVDAQEMPLVGVSVASGEGEPGAIEITLGGAVDRTLTHRIGAPGEVRVKYGPRDRFQGVEITSFDGPAALLTTRAVDARQ